MPSLRDDLGHPINVPEPPGRVVSLVPSLTEAVAGTGLLVGATIWGREELTRRLTADWQGQLRVEWALAAQPRLADLGKQLMVVARRPGPARAQS